MSDNPSPENRIKTLTESPTYRLATDDPESLEHDDLRAVCLLVSSSSRREVHFME